MAVFSARRRKAVATGPTKISKTQKIAVLFPVKRPLTAQVATVRIAAAGSIRQGGEREGWGTAPEVIRGRTQVGSSVPRR
jgi:hypothetical protein